MLNSERNLNKLHLSTLPEVPAQKSDDTAQIRSQILKNHLEYA